MSIRVEWENKSKTAVRMVYERYWNWRDHFIALDAVNTLLATANQSVDLMLDLRYSMPLPDSTTWNVSQTPADIHANWSGRAIVLTTDAEMAHGILAAMPTLSAVPEPAQESV